MAALQTSAITLPAPSLAQERDALTRMRPEQRLVNYRRGSLTMRQCYSWAARWPDEVPLLNGEFEFIARSMADLD
jgi:hypothetical protein